MKRNAEGARSAVVPSELKGNKISVSDIRKRPLDHEETRAPLSALRGSTTTPSKLESDFTAAHSPAKPSAKEGTKFYRKRQKTDEIRTRNTTPQTPPLRSSRRSDYRAASPPPETVLAPLLRTQEISVPEAPMPVVEGPVPVVEQAVEIQSLEPIRRQLLSPTNEPPLQTR